MPGSGFVVHDKLDGVWYFALVIERKVWACIGDNVRRLLMVVSGRWRRSLGCAHGGIVRDGVIRPQLCALGAGGGSE